MKGKACSGFESLRMQQRGDSGGMAGQRDGRKPPQGAPGKRRELETLEETRRERRRRTTTSAVAFASASAILFASACKVSASVSRRASPNTDPHP
eukprot:3932827-Rhodomonas_salina.1